jgi:hypothetical protein
MLDYIDHMLRQLFVTRVAGITSDLQVRFQPPDDDWRTEVSTLGQIALNVYLVELKENRRLRSNERSRDVSLGIVTDTPKPRQVDCTYMITAWDPATATASVEPTITEHELLWGAATALTDADPLDPRQIYFPLPLPLGFPPIIADAELPTMVLPSEGFAKHAEFWGTMPGHHHPWRPAVFLVLTLPVTIPPIPAGPMVTTRISQYCITGRPETLEVRIEIGGTVLDGTVVPAAPVPGAWVQLENGANVVLGTTTTDSLGRFIFEGLQHGNYQLRYRAGARPEPPPRAVAVPSPTGEYDLTFT